ncbi:serpentine type 7TM GPCR chemoreceptor srv domain-containing protein [Ditylenchus destructor]|nr:serpentine type 7TM GPCR chemoreceptor srv domain-containing protein [Ditylenchus destructor]
MSIAVTVPFTDQEKIFTTLAPIPLTASPPLRIFGASSNALLSTLSISLNALLITILLRNRKQYKKEPFFLLTWQLILCDVLTQSMQLIIAVPITYANIPLRTFLYYQVAYLPVAMIVIYITIFVYLRYMTRSHMSSQDAAIEKEKNRRREHRLLFQSFLICGSLEIQYLAFNYLPYLNLQGQWSYVINFSQNWVSIFLNSITPIVMFSFNADIQPRLRALLGNISANKHSVQSTTLMVNSGPLQNSTPVLTNGSH